MNPGTAIRIPQTNPKANYLAHQTEIDAAIHRVLDSGRYILGQEVDAFETEFAAYIGVNYAVGVDNGTDALILSLQTCGIGRGDLVFTVSHTAVATIAAVEFVGAIPVLVDIDPVTYTMNPSKLDDAIQLHKQAGRPAAILPVHLYGYPANMAAVLDIAHQNGLYVIEDCAQSHGAALAGKKTGAWGHVASFSFYPTKNLGALGDGGIVVSNDSKLAERARLLRQYGWKQRYISEIPGSNSRLDELQAAVLRVKLAYLDQENLRRRSIAELYNQRLSNTGLVLPLSNPETTHAYHQYAVRVTQRDALQAHLHEQGIGTLVHYPQAVHQQPAYAGRLLGTSKLPNSELVVAEVLSLPMYPELLDEEVMHVIAAIRKWCEHA